MLNIINLIRIGALSEKADIPSISTVYGELRRDCVVILLKMLLKSLMYRHPWYD